MFSIFYIRLEDFFSSDSPDAFFRRVLDPLSFAAGEAYRNEKVRLEKWGGAAVLAYLLKRFFQLENCTFFRTGQGKPYVADRPGIFFNISHSAGYLVVALCEAEVGIDIEKKRRGRMEVARRFFHPEEVGILESKEGKEKDDYFFRYWSVKESFLKYTGEGLGRALSSFLVRWEENGAGIYKENIRLPLYIRACEIDPDYSCYVCSAWEAAPRILPLTWEEIARGSDVKTK